MLHQSGTQNKNIKPAYSGKESLVKAPTEVSKCRAVCGAVYKESVCVKRTGHFGKHVHSSDASWVAWTDGGARRVAREEAARLQKEKDQAGSQKV